MTENSPPPPTTPSPPWTLDKILHLLRQTLQEAPFSFPASQLRPRDTRLADLSLDSLDYLDLLYEVETRLDNFEKRLDTIPHSPSQTLESLAQAILERLNPLDPT